MSLPHISITPSLGHLFPLIDDEFDRFEVTTDLEETLREAETANFYHDSLNNED